MSADTIKTFFHIHGPNTKTTFLVDEVIGYAVGSSKLVIYFRGGGTILFDGFNSTDEVSDLAARIQTAMDGHKAEASEGDEQPNIVHWATLRKGDIIKVPGGTVLRTVVSVDVPGGGTLIVGECEQDRARCFSQSPNEQWHLISRPEGGAS